MNENKTVIASWKINYTIEFKCPYCNYRYTDFDMFHCGLEENRKYEGRVECFRCSKIFKLKIKE